MSHSDNSYLFTSESVTEGHPDKVADQISDGVLDACLAADPGSRVACETLVNTNLAVVSGEITTGADLDFDKIVRDTVRRIGYVGFDPGFDADKLEVLVRVDKQSPDIAQGVNASDEVRSGQAEGDEAEQAGAGDQGMMFGYASNETDHLMPMPIHLAHRLAERLTAVRKDGTHAYLRPDGKTQVSVRYENGRPTAVEKVLISTQHGPGAGDDSLVGNEDGTREKITEDLWNDVIKPVFAEEGVEWDENQVRQDLLINPTGVFIVGGPVGDCGLTGRKIIVDTYGGMARHGGGAFSGKDPSKVDRSAAYAARHVAKNVVAAGLADRAEVQVAYAIGVASPVSVMVETFGTEKIGRGRIQQLIDEHFDLRPGAFRRALDLHNPIYVPTAAYGHFGRDGFSWERTDKAEELRAAAGL